MATRTLGEPRFENFPYSVEVSSHSGGRMEESQPLERAPKRLRGQWSACSPHKRSFGFSFFSSALVFFFLDRGLKKRAVKTKNKVLGRGEKVSSLSPPLDPIPSLFLILLSFHQHLDGTIVTIQQMVIEASVDSWHTVLQAPKRIITVLRVIVPLATKQKMVLPVAVKRSFRSVQNLIHALEFVAATLT